MGFSSDIALPERVQDQIHRTLSQSIGSFRKLDRDNASRAADKDLVLAALGASRQLPVLHTIADLGLINEDLLKRFDPSGLRHYTLLPLCEQDGLNGDRELLIAIADPFITGWDHHVRDYYESSVTLCPVLTHASEITRQLNRVFKADEDQTVLDGVQAEQATSQRVSAQIVALDEKYDENPAAQIVTNIVRDALVRRASDIHFESNFNDDFYVRIRIDGDLVRVKDLDVRSRKLIDNYLAGVAGNDQQITSKGLPISGKFVVQDSNRRVNIRYERIPTMEDRFTIVLRILDKSNIRSKLGSGQLEMDPKAFLYLQRMLDQPEGLIVICGRTGSGKSTTLMAMLEILNQVRYKIFTLENPVEQELLGVNHCNIEDVANASPFSRGFMRADPDIIQIGEIRDLETGDRAAEMAITGHLVASTIHCASPSMIPYRLMQLGIDRWKVSETLIGCLAQTLVRMICPECKRIVQITKDDIDRFALPPELLGTDVAQHVQGELDSCKSCNGTGYKGRRALIEVHPITPSVRELIAASDFTPRKLAAFIKEKFQTPTLIDLGLEMLRHQSTDLDELKEVLPLAFEGMDKQAEADGNNNSQT